jgi:hypothetical protein
MLDITLTAVPDLDTRATPAGANWRTAERTGVVPVDEAIAEIAAAYAAGAVRASEAALDCLAELERIARIHEGPFAADVLRLAAVVLSDALSADDSLKGNTP